MVSADDDLSGRSFAHNKLVGTNVGDRYMGDTHIIVRVAREFIIHFVVSTVNVFGGFSERCSGLAEATTNVKKFFNHGALLCMICFR